MSKKFPIGYEKHEGQSSLQICTYEEKVSSNYTVADDSDRGGTRAETLKGTLARQIYITRGLSLLVLALPVSTLPLSKLLCSSDNVIPFYVG